jgi:hypothetical protein
LASGRSGTPACPAAFHRQFLHARGDRRAERLGGLGTCFGQLFGIGQIGFLCFGLGSVQAVQIRGGVQCGQLRATRGVFLRQRLRLQTEFARGRMQGVDASFDLGEPVGVQFEPLRVVAQRIGSFLQLDFSRLERSERIV